MPSESRRSPDSVRRAGVGPGQDRRTRRPRRVGEVLVLEPEHGPAPHGQVAAAGQALGVEPGGPVEGLGHRGPPVDHQRLVVRAGHGQPADVERLAQHGLPWPSPTSVAVPSPSPSPVGKAVDAAEAERLVADVELLQAGQAGADHDVPLGAGLERAAPAQVEDALEHVAGLPPHGLETIVGAIEELLLGLQIGMVRHLAPFSPGPSGKRFSLDDGRRRGGTVHAAYDDPATAASRFERTTMLISTMNDVPGYRVTRCSARSSA